MIPLEYIIADHYVPQISDEKNDILYYELGRFLELLRNNNPNIHDLLYTPADCILINDPIMEVLIENREKFISKQCRLSYSGYAYTQIRKARGLDKKVNWEASEMKRKTVLDFCYLMIKDKTVPFKEWLMRRPMFFNNHKNYGLSKIDHARDTFAMHYIFFEPNIHNNLYGGVVSDEETANDVHLTSFSKEAPFITHLVFNKDGYSSHAKKYKEYQDWLKNHNKNRITIIDSGKPYDSKNLLHCLRLLYMAKDIADGKGIVVRRSPEECKKLIGIRMGEFGADDILTEAEELVKYIDEAFEKSDLQDDVPFSLCANILSDMRHKRYSI